MLNLNVCMILLLADYLTWDSITRMFKFKRKRSKSLLVGMLQQFVYLMSLRFYCQITQHKWAWPFMQPVDVEGLGLHDYYEV